jgi:hypothetical protein
MSLNGVTFRPVVTEPVDPGRYRRAAAAEGVVHALTLLHTETSPGVLPAGPAGHVLVPQDVESACDHYSTPSGVRARATGRERRLGLHAAGPVDLIALNIAAAGPAPATGTAPGWQVGVCWVRLGLAERLLAAAAAHLRGRTVQGTATLNLPQVRAMLADAAGCVAQAHALLATARDDAPLRQAHRELDEAGRLCLHLFGATGFLSHGPGEQVRASELLADAYAPADDLEWP